ncbi:heat shock protein DnaJ domain-containing protein [Chondrocystis sp. NIES-4102]|nr:heat shock protein DnaJ domain-containing protein [Chondrocystis sp. NIES-4102]
MNNISQCYAILGIQPKASPEATKKAYRNLAKIWHPDRYTDNPALKAKAEIEIKKINQAYATIKDYLANGSNNIIDVDVNSSQPSVNKQQRTPEFFYQQGVAYAESQNYQDALNSFAKAIKLNADFLEAYQYRGFILSKLGYEYQADAEFRKIHQIKVRNQKSKQAGSKSNSVSQQPYTTINQPSVSKLEDIYKQSFATNPNINKSQQNKDFLQCYYQILLDNSINHLAISYSNQIFASASNEPKIQLWDLKKGQLIAILAGHTAPITCLTISQTGQTLISGSQDQTIRFWDLRSKKIIRTFGGYGDGHLGSILAVEISPDNQTLFSYGADSCLKIWDINRAREINNITVTSEITCLAVSPDGQLFTSGGLDPEINIRQTKTGQIISSINNEVGVLSIAFSPDGNLLATGSYNHQIKLWDLTTGKLIYILEGHKDRISTVVFGKDGRSIISSSWDSNIKLWQLTTGKEIASIQAHNNKINSIAIACDYQTLVSSSSDKTIKLWQCNW